MAVLPQKVVVEPGGGRVLATPGVEFAFKVQADQTSGAFSIVEFVGKPGMFVPPHFHERTDEVSYILEGELGVMVAEEEFQALPGSFVVRPRGVPHALWNIGDRPVRGLDIYSPAGFEAWFDELARLFSSTPPPDSERVAEVARRYDVVLLPELIPPLLQKYNLRMPG
jgi:quercetin dioxygenase-like cupin family protein